MTREAMLRIAVVTAAVLAVPLVAMQLTDEVDWQPGDFAMAGVLLVGAGVAYELLARRAGTSARRAVMGLSIAAVFLLVWSILAVGLD